MIQINYPFFVLGKKKERSEKVNPNFLVLLPERARAVKQRSCVQTAPLFRTIKKFHFLSNFLEFLLYK